MAIHERPIKGLTDSWITPKEIVQSLGEFDLDPCQCTPQPWPCAKSGFTIADDGLSKKWFGRVWLNPPYSDVGRWLKRLGDHGAGTALIFARTETRWFRNYVWYRASSVLFLWGRLSFCLPGGQRGGGSTYPSCLVSFGDYDASRLKASGLRGTYCSGWGNQFGDTYSDTLW